MQTIVVFGFLIALVTVLAFYAGYLRGQIKIWEYNAREAEQLRTLEMLGKATTK